MYVPWSRTCRPAGPRRRRRRPRRCVLGIVAIFYPFSHFCEINISLPSLQKQPNTAPNLFQRGVEYGKYPWLPKVDGNISSSPPLNKKPPLIRNPPLGGNKYCYYQFRRRHDYPPHKNPPLGGKYCYYRFRRRHYQFRQRGGFLLGGEIILLSLSLL